jgi:hypothetical protein
MHRLDLAWKLKHIYFLIIKKKSTTFLLLQPITSKKLRIINKNNNVEKLNTIEIFDKDNKLNNGATMIDLKRFCLN